MVDIILKNGELIKISGLDDLIFFRSGDQWEVVNSSICVFSTAETYSLEARSQNSGLLKNSQDEGIRYYSSWADKQGVEHSLSDLLSGGTEVLTGLRADNTEGCQLSSPM
ncbi:hypothetical protein [Endozoicomonas atrinae]|uniref:hypothetical protein n=1 Tax=Endozoicomonas atrinae TaxID=1333660 RepID=UPI00082694F8|nr:hypothetical protein [Endozoicomonas atrinae]